MDYIVHRRFKTKAICGDVNIPYGTVCTVEGAFIMQKGKRICAITSENAHQFFSLNDDGCGLERGKLTQTIQKILAKRDKKYQARWDKVWKDHVCQQYKRFEHQDYWLWNHAFYNAPIKDLKHIATLIGVKN